MNARRGASSVTQEAAQVRRRGPDGGEQTESRVVPKVTRPAKARGCQPKVTSPRMETEGGARRLKR